MGKITLHIDARSVFVPYLQRTERWSCIVAHRRCGKTVACVQDLIAKAIKCKRQDGRFAYIAPTYRQAKDTAWLYLKRYTSEIPGVQISESELSVMLPNGARLRLYGAENYDSLRGLYLDGAVIDEAGDIDPRAFPEVIRPALADRLGWCTWIGTPKGANEFKRIYEMAKCYSDWFSAILKASETGLIDGNELVDAKRLLTQEQYAQEFECSFAGSVTGSIYGRDLSQAEEEKRITSVPYDRAADVFAAWDLGIGDSTAIWVGQLVGKETHFLRYYEASSEALDHYVDWVKALPFTVHDHYLPHDADARELQTGSSRTEFLEGRGLNCTVLPSGKVEDRINKARVKFPSLWFDADGCERGLECLRNYRYDMNEKLGALKRHPRHDWASHGADAFGYALQGAQPASAKTDISAFEVTADWVV